ncbi:glycine--tRNA ligase subunit beta [Candidatus Hydrogenosomobacter endosymbioticus]|uniref:Glycine--tRNA ligase beta subunit n=1 Tax=Candidatus Hydrogenosomobacter endosymbioticus TaxID=2558174 RepID=A0ABN6L7B2_9PROT|nr:glycine--tRNA ligase subunit beta [Candidatus Hydrogenosomobacter endosymbioticus]BDB96065.1 glycine--tRNA ligase beta subunit [Candidatus Hydrogenosomobacter endosymbioticus]
MKNGAQENMDVTSFLLEIFSEEIPARMQASAAEQIKKLAESFLLAEGVRFLEIESFVTPRRLSLIVSKATRDSSCVALDKKGPPVGVAEVALKKFCESNAVSAAECYKKSTEKGEFWFAPVKISQKSLERVFSCMCFHILETINWPKTMRWADDKTGRNCEICWIRPIRSILCVQQDCDGRSDARVVDFSFGNLVSSSKTCGHRFANRYSGYKNSKKEELCVKNISEYEQLLRDNFVILRQDERKQLIRDMVLRACEGVACEPFSEDLENGGLVDEVCGLVEFPSCIVGSFDEKFLSIPQEVIATTIRENQRYFPMKKDDKLHNMFCIVTNTAKTTNEMKEGCERVVRARLSDALFFWSCDKSKKLEHFAERLKNRALFDGLGSVYDKSERVRMMCIEFFGDGAGFANSVSDAARIFKADLETETVSEFPSLQGSIGKHLALLENKRISVARSIEDHYWPQGEKNQENLLSQSEEGRVLGIFDRMDTLVGFFAIGKVPSGSKDPFGLRRASYGLARLMQMCERDFSLKELIRISSDCYKSQGLLSETALSNVLGLEKFCTEKFINIMREEGVEERFVLAAIEQSEEIRFKKISETANMLMRVFSSNSGQKFLSSYKRVSSILCQNEYAKKSDVDENSFATDYEKRVFDIIKFMRNDFSGIGSCSMETLLIERFDLWSRAIDDFFDNVKVMEEGCFAARIALLRGLSTALYPLCDMDRMVRRSFFAERA